MSVTAIPTKQLTPKHQCIKNLPYLTIFQRLESVRTFTGHPQPQESVKEDVN